MDSSPRVKFEIRVRNLPPWIKSERRTSIVSVRVERRVYKYKYSTLHNRPVLSSSGYHAYDPEPFTFPIDTSTDFSQIYQILHHQYNIDSQLSRSLASGILRKADDMNVGRSDIMVGVLVKISRKIFLQALVVEDGEDNQENLVLNLVRDCVINRDDDDELGLLENECCSICLTNLLGCSGRILTRMACSHLFHHHCIFRWLCRKNTCPVCRRVLYEG